MLIKRALTLVGGVALVAALAACGSSTGSTTSSTSAAASSAAASSAAPSAMSSPAMSSDATSSDATSSDATRTGTSAMSGDAAPASLVGPGCADYAATVPSGAGSVEGMAADPVAVAASNNPLLTSLTAAVSGTVNPQVNLVTTLNNGAFTVFAPVDAAFAKIDAATMDSLTTNAALLSGILTYHVVPGRLSPAEVVGIHPTANGATLTVTGSGDALQVNGANVICGGVQTKNATVYLINQVLTPPAA